MTRHKPLKCIGAEVAAARTGEDGITRLSRLPQQPPLQDGDDIRSQRRASHLPAFAKAADVRARAERHVVTTE
jgi:hypothetical protein